MEIEVNVQFFRNDPPDVHGIARTRAGNEVFLAASTFVPVNGHRVFPKNGEKVLMQVVRMKNGAFATSWRVKPKEEKTT